MKSRLFIGALAAWFAGLHAASAAPTVKPVGETAEIELGDRALFRPYEDSYLLLHRMKNNGWAGDDERALRAHYSFHYVFIGNGRRDVSLSYTGEFDFYMGSRPSDPVVNRISNPALHVRWAASDFDFMKTALPTDHFDLGLEHESDGQTIEVTSAREVESAQRAYSGHDRPYFDQVSRGSNFFSFAAVLSEQATGWPVAIHARARAYLGQNTAVTWGPLAGSGVRLSDYDRLCVRIGKQVGSMGSIEVRWTVGDSGFKTDSFGLGWQGPRHWPLPLYVRVNHGPLNTLSNYTQRQDSVGIGLRFAAF